MKESISILELINICILAINIIWGIYNSSKTQTYEAKQKYAPTLIEKIFNPFYKEVECRLFIKITKRNKPLLIQNMNNLYATLEKEQLLFYISENLLLHLDFMVNNHSNCSLRKFNRRYQAFSNAYIKELNHVRKVVGLKPRTTKFRTHFDLYNNNFAIFLAKHPLYSIFLYVISCTALSIIFVLLTNRYK